MAVRFSLAAAAALLAFTAGLSVHGGAGSALGPASAAAAQLEELQRGRTVLNASCQACHERRVIETQALTFQAWTETIHKMIEMGAEVAAEDIVLLAEYLTIYHGPVPDGPGRDILLNTCTSCHDLMKIKLGRRTADEWEDTLVTMLNEGAILTDREFALIHHYLSRNFNVE